MILLVVYCLIWGLNEVLFGWLSIVNSCIWIVVGWGEIYWVRLDSVSIWIGYILNKCIFIFEFV